MSHQLQRPTIRDLATLEEYLECCEIQEEIWGRGFSERVPAAILRVSQKVGGVTAGAFDGNGRMVGFVFGLTGLRDGRPAHWSDMLAVREEARGHHIGDQLKHYQRECVRALGVDLMLWTYDPLVARNAHFNFNRLGAFPVEYVENMYGSTGSALHGSMPTDRFVIGWTLSQAEHAEAAASVVEGDAQIPLSNPIDAAGHPCLSLPDHPAAVRVQIPDDIAKIQAEDPAAALRWRLNIRQAMVALYARGGRATRFVRSVAGHPPYYVVTPPA
ncbi:MAG: hypothetical protein ABIZ91_10195 [Gemmatimonadaceae bacterium]